MTTAATSGRTDAGASNERRLEAIETVGETATPVTNAIFARVPAGAVAALPGFLNAEQRAELARFKPSSANYKRKMLQFGVGGDAPGFEKAGLLNLQVPEEVHTVVGNRQPAGNLHLCDLFVDVLTAAGASIGAGDRILDFGASSGRVIRNLAAYYPKAVCEACDPRRDTIEWAAAHIPKVRFFVSDVMPPLPVEAGHYKAVYAISVWSHFSEKAALAWFSEMHRVIAPGGLLVFTTHGYASILHRKRRADPGPARIARLLDGLDAGRLLFDRHPAKSQAPDLDRDNWGVAFIPKTWVETRLADGWEVALFQQGRLGNNQDVYVLRRRPGAARPSPIRNRGFLSRLFGR